MSFARAFARNRAALAGLAVLLAVAAVAVLAPVLYPASPLRLAGRPMLPPGADPRFLLGTDSLGRDLASGLVHGARVSLLAGLASTAVAMLIGVPLGALAGWAGGLVDDALTRIVEFFQTIPSFALAIVLVAVLEPSLPTIVASIALVSWPPLARLVRAEVMALRGRDYVQASLALGRSPLRTLAGDVLPNILGPLVAMVSLTVASAILLESSLSFLGLRDPALVSWGYLVAEGRSRLLDAPWISLFPGLAIFATVLALNLAGEGLSDALDPRRSRAR